MESSPHLWLGFSPDKICLQEMPWPATGPKANPAVLRWLITLRLQYIMLFTYNIMRAHIMRKHFLDCNQPARVHLFITFLPAQQSGRDWNFLANLSKAGPSFLPFYSPSSLCLTNLNYSTTRIWLAKWWTEGLLTTTERIGSLSGASDWPPQGPRR